MANSKVKSNDNGKLGTNIILTKEGQKELEIELKRLIEVDRPQVIAEIKEAREQGDLSENTEFDVAREKQGQIEDRIKEIEGILLNSQLLRSSHSGSHVRAGAVVEIKVIATGKRETYTIVGSLEANPFEHKISNISPLAQAIINAKEGDIVTVDAVKKYDVEIVSVK